MLGVVTASQSAVLCRTGLEKQREASLTEHAGWLCRIFPGSQIDMLQAPCFLVLTVPTSMAEAECIIFLGTFFMNCDYVHPPEVESEGTASG